MAGALERGPIEVAHHAKNKTMDALGPAQLLKAEAKIAAGSKLQRQGTHRKPKKWSQDTTSGGGAPKRLGLCNIGTILIQN